MTENKLFYPLAQYCYTFDNEFELIPEVRKHQLHELAEYIFDKQMQHLPINFNVICTHNSRRSHIGQLWLAAAAACFDIKNLKTYSGGTESTAFNPRSVAALRRAGFEIVTSYVDDNPIYFSTFNYEHVPLKMFSKKYDHKENPNNSFAAIMVCSSADEGCPIIHGADKRFSLTYDDPKKFDDTELESEKYDERVRQIGREMFYAMYYLKEEIARNN